MSKNVAHALGFALCGSALIPFAVSAEQFDGTALVRHAPTLNGYIEGSVQQMSAESTTINSGAVITDSLFVPGLPSIQINGNPIYGGTLDGTGSTAPSTHRITINGGADVGNIVRRTDPVTLTSVSAPPQPVGTRSVSLNNAGQSAGDFGTLRNLTLNSNVGQIAVPAGTYGNFTANSGSRFALGVAGATSPAVYYFQNLSLNSNSALTIVGPVIVTLNSGFSTNAVIGAADHPEWLKLRIANNGLTLNGNISVYAFLEAPIGTLIVNGGGRFIGSASVDRLIVNSGGTLRLISPDGQEMPSTDVDHDGMDDAWEIAHGLNPLVDDSNLDNDHDGLSNLEEFRRGLNPTNPDTDGDGIYDGDEIALGLDPKVASPDLQPPSAPASLATSTVASDHVTLTWPAATDNLKVSGYIVYRDGQPIETATPIRDTTFTDGNLPDGEEFTYQVRAFDYAGNLSPFGPELLVSTVAADTDGDGLPDEWERKYFGEADALPGADDDGDGLTNLQEFQAGSDPKDFFNGVKPLVEMNGGQTGPNDVLTMTVKHPDGSPWPNAPVTFTVDRGSRRIAPIPGGPDFSYQLKVRADGNGLARVYLEALNP